MTFSELEHQLAAAKRTVDSYERSPLGECYSCKKHVCEHIMRMLEVREHRIREGVSELSNVNRELAAAKAEIQAYQDSIDLLYEDKETAELGALKSKAIAMQEQYKNKLRRETNDTLCVTVDKLAKTNLRYREALEKIAKEKTEFMGNPTSAATIAQAALDGQNKGDL